MLTLFISYQCKEGLTSTAAPTRGLSTLRSNIPLNSTATDGRSEDVGSQTPIFFSRAFFTLDISGRRNNDMGPILKTFVSLGMILTSQQLLTFAHAEELEVVHRNAPCPENTSESCVIIDRTLDFLESTPRPARFFMPGTRIPVLFEKYPVSSESEGIRKERLIYTAAPLEHDWLKVVFPISNANRLATQVRNRIIARIAAIHVRVQPFLNGAQVIHIPGDRYNRLEIEIPAQMRGIEVKKALQDSFLYVLDQELRGQELQKLRSSHFKQDLLQLTPLNCSKIAYREERESCRHGLSLSWVRTLSQFPKYIGSHAEYGSAEVWIGRISPSRPLPTSTRMESFSKEQVVENENPDHVIVCNEEGLNCTNEGLKTGRWIWLDEAEDMTTEMHYLDDLREGSFRTRCDRAGHCESEGSYSRDKQTGYWKEACFENFDSVWKCSDGNYVDDQREGYWRLNYPDGRYEEGNFRNGVPIGIWKECPPNSDCEWIDYKDGPTSRD